MGLSLLGFVGAIAALAVVPASIWVSLWLHAMRAPERELLDPHSAVKPVRIGAAVGGIAYFIIYLGIMHAEGLLVR